MERKPIGVMYYLNNRAGRHNFIAYIMINAYGDLMSDGSSIPPHKHCFICGKVMTLSSFMLRAPKILQPGRAVAVRTGQSMAEDKAKMFKETNFCSDACKAEYDARVRAEAEARSIGEGQWINEERIREIAQNEARKWGR